jgi:hypothetical protein
MTYPTPVIIRSKLVRKTKYEGLLTLKVWTPEPMLETRGWIIQKDTLANGVRNWGYGSVTFHHKESFSAYRVVFNLNRAPVWVRVEDVEFVGDAS